MVVLRISQGPLRGVELETSRPGDRARVLLASRLRHVTRRRRPARLSARDLRGVTVLTPEP